MIEEEDNGFQECLDTARGMDTIACTAPASTIPRPASTAPFRDSEPLATGLADQDTSVASIDFSRKAVI
jgi:hypothetical protein